MVSIVELIYIATSKKGPSHLSEFRVGAAVQKAVYLELGKEIDNYRLDLTLKKYLKSLYKSRADLMERKQEGFEKMIDDEEREKRLAIQNIDRKAAAIVAVSPVAIFGIGKLFGWF